MTDQASQQKVVSRSAAANELIGELRTLAKGIADLGDAREDSEQRMSAAMDSEVTYAEQAEEATGTLIEWTTAIEDYRRGILDRDELFERTVGRA